MKRLGHNLRDHRDQTDLENYYRSTRIILEQAANSKQHFIKCIGITGIIRVDYY